VTPYVIAEVCWMAASRIGATAEANVIDAVAAGELRQVTIEDDELRRIGELLHQYGDLHGGQGLSLADASVVAVAEHRGVREIATLDVTDFSLVRPRHVPHFTLLP
jgi:predicted nucleic acid-binding protein